MCCQTPSCSMQCWLPRTFYKMNIYTCLAVLFEVSSIFGLSVVTGSESKNTTYSDETVREVKNFDVLQQLLNQEATIRMSMAKYMLSLKQSLVGDMSVLKQTTAELKNDLQKLKRENERLCNKNVKCSENVNLVLGNSDKMNKTIDNLSSAVSSLDVKISKNSRNSSVKVAFTAGMTSSSSSFSGGTLVFPAVITNVGGGYNPSTGVFSAPNGGLYVFYISGLEYSNQYLRLDIVWNGVSKVRLIGEHDARYQTGTNMAVLNLQQGDRVWVKHTLGKGYYSQNVPITTFSGFQI